MKPLEYLATPFWHKSQHVRYLRYEAALDILTHLTNAGRIIFCPVAHNYNMSQDVNFTNEQWVEYDFNFLARCQKLLIATIPGWRDSEGIKKETEFALTREIQLEFVDAQKILEPDKFNDLIDLL